MRTLLMLSTLALGLASTTAAQSVIKTRSGQTFNAIILEDTGTSLKIKTDEGFEMTLPYANLAPKTLYQIERGRTADDDAQGLLKLGDVAVEAGLWSNAKTAYLKAEKADASLTSQIDAKLATLRDTASKSLLDEAQKEVKRDQAPVAEKHLSTLLNTFPDEAASDQARTMLTDLHAQQDAERKAKIAKEHTEAVQKALAPAQKKYDEMRKKIQTGLTTKNQSQQIDDFKAAASEGETGRKELKKVDTANDSDLAGKVQELDGELVDQIVSAYSHLASAYNQRTSYNDAYNAVNQALALKPDDKELLNLRSQIASNTADDSYGFYGRGPRRLGR